MPHATFYFLYTIMRLATLDGAKPENAEYKAMIKYYTRAKREIAKAVQQERKSLRGHEEIYNHRVFFKGDRPKQHIDAALRQKTAR